MYVIHVYGSIIGACHLEISSKLTRCSEIHVDTSDVVQRVHIVAKIGEVDKNRTLESSPVYNCSLFISMMLQRLHAE